MTTVITRYTEKTAFDLRTIPFLGNYVKKFNREIMRPIFRKGLLGGMAENIGKQVVPTSYSSSLLDQAKMLRLKRIQGLGTMPREQYNQLGTEYKDLMMKYKKFTVPGEPMANGMKPARVSKPGAVANLFSADKFKDWATFKKNVGPMGSAAMHYIPQALNTAMMVGMPAHGLYTVAKAPEGQKGEAFGKTIGENMGFFGAGRLGILPSIGGSMLGSYVGGKAGKRLSSAPAPQQPNVMGYMPQKLQPNMEQFPQQY